MIIIGAILSQINRSQQKSTKPLPYSRKIKIGGVLLILLIFVTFCYQLSQCSGTGLPTTATSSSPEDRSAAGNESFATDNSPSAEGVRTSLPLDAPLGAGTLAAGALTLLVVTAVDSSGRLDFGTDNLEVDRLVLGLLGAGSGVLLHGTSGSLIISLLLLIFLDIIAEMLYHTPIESCNNKNQNGISLVSIL